jgi:hypothetical protein
MGEPPTRARSRREIEFGNLHARQNVSHCRTPNLVSAIFAVCIDRAPTKPDASGSLRSLGLAKRCAALDHKTAPRLQISAVPSRDGRPPDPTRLCQKDTAGCPDLFGDPRGSRERAARLGRAVVLLRDLAAQLCVSRGTLRVAYERLSNSSCRRTVVGCWNWRDARR